MGVDLPRSSQDKPTSFMSPTPHIMNTSYQHYHTSPSSPTSPPTHTDTIVSAVESPHNDLITTITTMNSPAGSLMDAEATAAATQQEAALLEVGRSKHHVITGALKARLTNYDVWGEGDYDEGVCDEGGCVMKGCV